MTDEGLKAIAARADTARSDVTTLIEALRRRTPREIPSNGMSLYGTITLGALIDALSAIDTLDRDGREKEVMYDRWFVRVTTVASYRGYYDHLALGWAQDGERTTITVALERLRSAIGQTFSGYKGGSYRMNRDTPIWADNWGQGAGVAIVGVVDDGWRVVLKTEVPE